MTLQEEVHTARNVDTPVIQNIYNEQGSKLIAVSMKQGMVLPEHKSLCKANLFVIKGEIDFNTTYESIRLATADSYEIPMDQTHTVAAREDALFLLLMDKK